MGLEEVVAFLDREAKKGTLNGATATAMKAACTKVQDFLEEGEDDIKWLENNLESVFVRVANKDGALNQSSLQTYKSRALKALNLYQNFKEDPMGWHKNLQHRTRKKQNGAGEGKETKANSETPHSGSATGIADVLFPFRDDFDFRAKLPKDATMKEIFKLCYRLMTLAKDFDPMWPKSDWFAGSGGRANPSREIE